MAKTLRAPGKYIQGAGELDHLGDYMKGLCNKCLVVISESGLKRFGERVKTSLDKNRIQYEIINFNGECSYEEIDRLSEIGNKNNCELVVSIGGGKTLDTGRATAIKMDVATIVVPTIASNDSPCSGLSVVYSNEGIPQGAVFAKRNPDLVLVDSQVIANAPVRMFAAGMGDALSTYFEARACIATHAENCAGGYSTNAAFMMSELCYNLIMKYGLQALEAVKEHKVTDELDNVLEATILLSGLGFESAGLAGAHPINDGLTYIPEVHGALHGERVAIGTITQLVLEGAPEEELNGVIDFCIKAGLPVCLEDIGIKEVKEEQLRQAAKGACEDVPFIHNLPVKITPEIVYEAIIKGSEIGKSRKIK